MAHGLNRKGAEGEKACVNFATKKKKPDIFVDPCGLRNSGDNISEPERAAGEGIVHFCRGAVLTAKPISGFAKLTAAAMFPPELTSRREIWDAY
jgi:hypothetical protein